MQIITGLIPYSDISSPYLFTLHASDRAGFRDSIYASEVPRPLEPYYYCTKVASTCTKLCSLVVLSSFFSTGGGAPLVPGGREVGMEKSSAIGVAFFFRGHNTRTRFFQKKDAPRGLPKGRPHGASITRPHTNIIQIFIHLHK